MKVSKNLFFLRFTEYLLMFPPNKSFEDRLYLPYDDKKIISN